MGAPSQALIAYGSQVGTLPVDLFIDFENSTAGTLITTTILAGGTHGAAPGTWTISYGSSGTNHVTIDSTNIPRRTPVLCNGVTYTGSGTRGLEFDMSGRTGLDNKYQVLFWTPSGSFTSVCITGLIKIGLIGTNSADTSIDQWVGNTSGFGVLQQFLPSTAFGTGGFFRAHGSVSTISDFGQQIPVVNGSTYYVALLLDQSAQKVQVAVIDPVTYVLVGASEVASDISTFTSLQIQDYLESYGGTTLWDSIAVDWTHHTFPGEAFTMPSPTVQAVQNGSSQIFIQWTTSYALEYQLERSVNGGSYSTIQTNTNLSYQDTGLTNGNTYTYRVTAQVNATSATPAVSGTITVNNAATGTSWQTQTTANDTVFLNASNSLAQHIKGISGTPLSLFKVRLSANTILTSGNFYVALTQNSDGTGTQYATSALTNVSATGANDFYLFSNTIPASTDFWIKVYPVGTASVIWNIGFIDPYLTGQGYDILYNGSNTPSGIIEDLTFTIYTP